MNATCLVTGSTGFVGRHLTRALLQQGRQVRALVTDEASARSARSLGAEPVFGDVTDPGTLAKAVQGASAVFHLAAQVRPHAWFHGAESLARGYRNVNVEGTRNLVRACHDRVADFVYFSSIAAVGVGRDLDEESPCHPSSDYGKSKRDAECLLLDAFRRDGFPAKIIRAGQVYGPENLPMLAFFKLVKHGFRPLVGDGSNRTPVCYIDDLVAISLLVEERGARGETYFAVNEPTTFERLVRSISAALGRDSPARAVPRWALEAAANLKDLGERATGIRAYPFRVDFGRESIAIASSDWICRNDKIRDRLGFANHTTIDEGIAQTVRWYEDNKLL